MQAFCEQELAGAKKVDAKKLEKSLRKVLTRKRVYDILFKLSRKEQRLDLEN